MKTVEFKKIHWIDFFRPSADDVLYLQENFSIHPLAIEEFMTPTIRPKATQYDNCLFLTVHIPLFDQETRTTFPGELDIVLTKDTLITGRTQEIYQLDNFFKRLEGSEGKRRLYMGESPAHLLYHLLQILLDSCFPKLDHIIQKLDRIEEEIFKGHESEMVAEISVVKRDILNFRRTLKPQRTVLESLSQQNMKLVPASLRPYFQDLIGTNIRIWNTLESTKETIESLEETNNSLLSNKLDTTMKVLTIFSAVLLPITLYSNMMSMSLNIPLMHSPNAFWVHASVMASIAFLTILIFRWKKWI